MTVIHLLFIRFYLCRESLITTPSCGKVRFRMPSGRGKHVMLDDFNLIEVH